ncbi:MAG TPA: AAA family ATPase [Thermoanaerobaculia bacterium]|nr:AAA family ATPase [Thermoanaerobaculia bacterium]
MDSIQPPGEASSVPEHVPFLRRVSIRNYKSIETADVSLRALTVLVGRNGSGKSNFLDALHFVADSLQTSLDHAFTSRGGFKEVRRRLVPTRLDDLNISIDLEVALPGGHRAKYGFVIGFDHEVGLRVQRETLQVNSLAGPVAYYGVHGYGVHGGLVEWSLGIIPPPHLGDRLYLVNVSGFAEFRPCYEALSSMTFYNLNPDSMKKPQALDTGDLLRRDGSNLANIVGRLGKEQPDTLDRITKYLSAISPGIAEIERVPLGPVETLLFRQEPKGGRIHEFYSWSMSDGTLRALAALVAVNQSSSRKEPVSLVGIEEPETALHPAATGALMDALREASSHTQVIVTTHSPDLLDHVSLETDSLLAVVSDQGKTLIAPIDEASREAIRNHLYTPGELLRLDQLEPDRNELRRQEQVEPAFEEDER